MNIALDLLAGRHDLPVSDFIFGYGDITFPINPADLQQKVAKKFDSLGLTVGGGHHITVFVTGLTPATTAVIRVAMKGHHFLTLKHFDRDSNGWIDDHILTPWDDLSIEAGIHAWG
ncbi:hypothetical protein HO415_06130 [Streptococcus suis]|nr:hypothetical protein [Streptococcus suis]